MLESKDPDIKMTSLLIVVISKQVILLVCALADSIIWLFWQIILILWEFPAQIPKIKQPGA